MRLIHGIKTVYFPANRSTQAGNTPFPRVPELSSDRVRVVGIMTIDNGILGLTPLGRSPVVPQGATGAPAILVTLSDGRDTPFLNVPYFDLGTFLNRNIWNETKPFRLDLSKSYITATAALGGDFDVGFMFAYIRV